MVFKFNKIIVVAALPFIALPIIMATSCSSSNAPKQEIITYNKNDAPPQVKRLATQAITKNDVNQYLESMTQTNIINAVALQYFNGWFKVNIDSIDLINFNYQNHLVSGSLVEHHDGKDLNVKQRTLQFGSEANVTAYCDVSSLTPYLLISDVTITSVDIHNQATTKTDKLTVKIPYFSNCYVDNN